MKKTFRYSVASLLLATTTTLIASEAYTPIAYGVKNRGMGGVSIANVQGAQSAFANPALLSFTQKNEISIGGTYSKQNTNSTAYDGTDVVEYDNFAHTISPYIVGNYHLGKSFNLGLGLTDYTLKNSMEYLGYNLITVQLRKTRVTLPVSYAVDNFSMGVSLIYEKFNYKFDDNVVGADSLNISDSSFGYDLGFAYNFKDTGLVIAADFKSEIKHPLTDQSVLNQGVEFNAAREIGLGMSWHIMNSAHHIALDYKKINSSEIAQDSQGKYTQDQNVFAIGYEYDAKTWQARMGYKYISNLYDKVTNATMDLAYPFATTSHYTLGGSYQLNDDFSADVAVVYAKYNHTTDNYDGINTYYTVKNNPVSISLGINYTF